MTDATAQRGPRDPAIDLAKGCAILGVLLIHSDALQRAFLFRHVVNQAVPVFVVLFAIGLPLFGNLFPQRLSFLLAMRYYAGNWPYSVWLFRGESHEKLKRLHERLALGDAAELLGELTDDSEVMRLYRRADVFCLPSVQEGFGIVFLEAAAAGRKALAQHAEIPDRWLARWLADLPSAPARPGGVLLRLAR